MIQCNGRKPQTLIEAVRFFSDLDACHAYLESIKWPSGKCCPKCGSVNVGTIKSRRRYQCRERECRAQFSLFTDTIMESTHLRADQWCIAIWMLVNCRNGVSSCEIARTIGAKQQSCWHLLHRARALLAPPERQEPFTGVCESDETFVGGLLKFMTFERRQRAIQRKHDGKCVVHAIKNRRTGTVRAEVIPAATTAYVQDAVLENVKMGSRLYTDESTVYNWTRGCTYIHKSVNHQVRFVDGTVHTNGCENFFNNLRRSLKGCYIKATPEHLPAYVNEAVWRFNVRHDTEWDRFLPIRVHPRSRRGGSSTSGVPSNPSSAIWSGLNGAPSLNCMSDSPGRSRS